MQSKQVRNKGLVDYICTLRKEAEASEPNLGVLRPSLE